MRSGLSRIPSPVPGVGTVQTKRRLPTGDTDLVQDCTGFESSTGTGWSGWRGARPRRVDWRRSGLADGRREPGRGTPRAMRIRSQAASQAFTRLVTAIARLARSGGPLGTLGCGSSASNARASVAQALRKSRA